LNARLSKEFPGRFKKTAPAAAELHVSLSVFKGQPVTISCAPDKDSEKHYRPDAEAVRRKLLIGDRGYQDSKYFMEITDANGYFLIRGTKNIKPIVLSAENAAGQRVAHLENKELCVKKFPRCSLNLIIQWGQASGHETYIGRLVVLYRPGPRNRKEFQLLHTNLPNTFTIDDIQKLYRLRWQIELIFKEWKSYSNLHGFATGIKEIAESLIWASLLTAIIKRTLVHAAELKLNMYLSTERATSTAMNYFLDIISAILLTSMKQLVATIEQMFEFFSVNARRAHPKRDRKSGRLQVDLCLPGKIGSRGGARS
jgi:hypothetical protein